VLIQTSGVLQQKAAQTGQQTTTQVSSGLEIVKILGYDANAPGGTITRLAIVVTPSSGTQSIDLNETIVTISDGTHVRDFVYNSSMYANETVTTSGGFNIFSTTVVNSSWYGMNYSGTIIKQYPTDDAPSTLGQEFGIMVLRDDDSSVSSSTPTLNNGDKVILTINLATNGMNLSARTTVTGKIKPEYGAPAIISFKTPSAYVDKVMTLQGS